MSTVMDKVAKENLFLLEFLVDQCVIEPKALPPEIAQDAGETCICFKFLDNEPLDVCEADFSPKRDYTAENSTMKSGKSCLFSLSPSQARDVSQSFDLEVSVFKKLASDAIPEKVQIGGAVVPVTGLFNELIALVQSAGQPETVSRTLKETYDVTSPEAVVIGSVTVFIRMSCFGKLIVTQFQMNLEDKSVFFKDKEGKSLYKYKKATKAEGRLEAECRVAADTVCDDDGNALYCSPDGKMPNAEGWKNYQQPGQGPPCNPERYEQCPAFKTGYEGPSGRPAGYGASAMDMRPSTYDGRKPDFTGLPPSGYTDKGCYQEIGASMNGNAVKIRMLRAKGTAKRLDKAADVPQALAEEPYSRYAPMPGNQTPCCSYGAYPSACAHQDKQVLNLKTADDPTNPFAFQVSGCEGPNNVTVVSPTSTRQDGMRMTEISDPNKDIFVLRIGKKSEGVDQKANLELELVTPKAVERKPPPKKETRETQYFECDVGPVLDKSDGGKKGKGKKGKGGKKGKKGKK